MSEAALIGRWFSTEEAAIAEVRRLEKRTGREHIALEGLMERGFLVISAKQLTHFASEKLV